LRVNKPLGITHSLPVPAASNRAKQAEQASPLRPRHRAAAAIHPLRQPAAGGMVAPNLTPNFN